ncbi:hypothetical protein DICPUDRAFT_156894 [Dictyostelium purpureum]|uniref:G8 domain-containing protein n=1 Tax=Dictyostelium purpureum TaxID=5786 RepID=F0ZXQ2_DICPU|nr:uncharacterized protein DICPUDRAFT_156894 [Dictyostelium purpureum]EGC31281.1 hypothetical protein DICPUDRAFT_156894 [Dictyostelium purpureum]|eukprot:XP_003292190.1 hypothetical protein DICPUDRAFT_156894 [Dictyostelium purpureum]
MVLNKNLVYLFIFYLFICKFNVVKSACESTAASWRPTVASSASPTSPAISTSQPALDFNLNANNLRYMAHWGESDTSIVNGPDTTGFTITYTNYGPDSHMLFYLDSAPALKANTNYQLSFGFKLGQTLGSNNNQYSSITLHFYDPKDVDPVHDTSAYFYAGDHTPLFSKVITGNFGSTSYVQFTTTITPTVDIGQSFMALQIQRTTSTGVGPTSIIFNNLKFTIPAKTITTPTLLTKDSELVVLPKAPSALDAQDLITCPYLSSDLKHWHDPATWGGVVPSPSSSIVLPANTKVLVSPCSISQTDIYTKITIPASSELVFFDADMTMNVKDIYVQGRLTMGSSKCRYNGKINLVFYGEKTTADTIATYFGSKGIAVADTGFISVQGKQYHNTWTKLAATAWSGDNTIYVQDSVNWEVGQEVLITTSIPEDEVFDQNEVKVIQAIQGKVIQFTTSLKYYHYGGQEYQSQVALLSRRIVFQGDVASSETNSFGGHVIVSGEGQFSGLRLNKMGQKNIKGRYPLHFHLAETVSNSYISDCSVTNSYYRCYTIHGTNNLTVTRNVAFNAMGHCYYLEDGVEMDNTLSYNLGAFVHTIYQSAAGYTQYGQDFEESDLLRQPADVSAGVFYITNAWNTIIGNSASGGWAGFAFPNLPAPIGNHRSVAMVPSQYPTKVFEGNSASSSGMAWEFGGSIYVGGQLSYGSNDLLQYSSGRNSRETFLNGDEDSTEVWMRFNNTKVFLSNRGLDHWGERVEVVTLESHDCHRPATLFGEAWFSNAIVNGQSGNILSKSTRYNRQGFQFYDTLVQTIVTNINFRNFIALSNPANNEEDNKVFISMTHSDIFKPQGISATRNISFTNVATAQRIGHKVDTTGSSRYFNFIDSDGTATGRTATTIVGSHDTWWNFDSSCSYNTYWACYVCNKGTKEIANLDVIVPNLIDGEEYDTSIEVGKVALFGSGITDERKTAITNNVGITGISDMGWYLYFTNGQPASMDVHMKQVPFGHYVFLAIRYPAGTTFSVSTYYTYYPPSSATKTFTQATSAAAVRSGDGSKYYFDGTHLFVKVVNFRLEGVADEYFTRGGATLNDVYWGMYLYIRATNTANPPVNGFFKNLSDVRPASTL